VKAVAALAIACLMVGTAADASPADDALRATTSGFYGVYMTLHPSDGVPDPSARARFAPFLSPGLAALLAQGAAAESRYAEVTKHQAPPLMEGDLFSPNFEGATAFRVGACQSEADHGRCAVVLTYDDRKDKPLLWTDTVLLARGAGGWQVDDIVYGGTGAFGNRGRLTEVLQNAIHDGDAFSH
jgi:hypothetical protein